ncbi:hypothetical protein ACLOJK_038942, partial [Asimina triloba]
MFPREIWPLVRRWIFASTCDAAVQILLGRYCDCGERVLLDRDMLAASHDRLQCCPKHCLMVESLIAIWNCCCLVTFEFVAAPCCWITSLLLELNLLHFVNELAALLMVDWNAVQNAAHRLIGDGIA